MTELYILHNLKNICNQEEGEVVEVQISFSRLRSYQ